MLERYSFVKHKISLHARKMFMLEYGIERKGRELGSCLAADPTNHPGPNNDMTRSPRPSKGRRVKETP
jgi:hypothetical protein